MQGNIRTKGENQVIFSFNNGFGASVIDNGYGGIGHPTNTDPTNPLYEIALLGMTKDGFGFVYQKRGPFKDVVGWLNADEVVAKLDYIRRLRKK